MKNERQNIVHFTSFSGGNIALPMGSSEMSSLPMLICTVHFRVTGAKWPYTYSKLS